MTDDELQAIRERCEDSSQRNVAALANDPNSVPDLHWQRYLEDIPRLLAEVERLRQLEAHYRGSDPREHESAIVALVERFVPERPLPYGLVRGILTFGTNQYVAGCVGARDISVPAAVLEERESCARLAEDTDDGGYDYPGGSDVPAAIRARSRAGQDGLKGTAAVPGQ